MNKIALLIPLLAVLLSCGLSSQPDSTTVMVGEPPLEHTGGALSLEEMIIDHDVIIRGVLATTTTEVVGDVDFAAETPDDGYRVIRKFNFRVDEYLKGSGPSSIVAVWGHGSTYETETEGEAAKSTVLAEIDTSLERTNESSILFLDSEDDLPADGSELEQLLRQSSHFSIGYGDPYYSDDGYSIHSEQRRAWLPLAPGTACTVDLACTYLLAPPPTDDTIQLTVLKQRVTAITAELARNSSDDYQRCVRLKYEDLRHTKNWPSITGYEYTNWNTQPSPASGSPAGTEIDRRDFLELVEYAPVRLEGNDSGLFTVAVGTSTTPNFKKAEIISTQRPLPHGEYTYTIKEQEAWAKPCNYTVSNEVKVTVTSHDGVLHEFFFDPVTVGGAVAADATNGVLKPASFTDANGASTTVESIAYEAGKVKVKVVPWTAMRDSVLDVITLDGTLLAPLTLQNSAVETQSNTLTWKVTPQPWKDGDKLVVRIRSAAPFASAPYGLSAMTEGEDSIRLSWNSASGVTGHIVERRASAEDSWETLDSDVTARSYTVTGLSCETTYRFRVGTYGDGTRYERVTRSTSYATVSGTTGNCSQGSPVFANAAYSFSIVEHAPVGATVGAVLATDPEDDIVTYSLVGNEGGRFAIDGSSGRITLSGTLDHDTASSHTLTAQASDGKGGKDTTTVSVTVEQASCSGGTAVANPTDNAGLVADCLTLLSARDLLEGTATLNWSDDVAIGQWQGVSVTGTPKRVRSLSLTDLDLDGIVPSGLGELAGLGSLRLDENSLTGNIPSELGKLSNLNRLSIEDARLTGSIPSELSRLSNLHTLALADNDLSGQIPVGLGGLALLRYLSLDGNNLTGSVPSQLGSLSNLQYLYLNENNLTGGIPSQLGSLSKLEILHLYGNGLTGAIPSQMGGLSKLEELALRNNALTGSIPSELEGLSKLVYLTLNGNNLTGCIPAGLSNVSNNDLARLGLAYCASSSP